MRLVSHPGEVVNLGSENRVAFGTKERGTSSSLGLEAVERAEVVQVVEVNGPQICGDS